MWGTGAETFGSSSGGGGGFMNNNTFSSPSGAGKGDRGARKPVNLFPVTIRQIHDCPDENLRIEDTDVHALTIVGIVRKVEITTTRVSFVIDDHTGTIEALSYVGPEESGSAEPQTVLLEGTYGRIVGSLRAQRGGGQKYILIFKVFPVTDMNEMTCHNLEVIQLPLKMKQARENEAKRTGFGEGMRNNTFTNTMVGGGFGGLSGSIGGPASSSDSGMGGFKPLEARVLAFIRASEADDGVHKDQIVAKMGISHAVLSNTIDSLSGEGHVYSTIDDDHYKATEP